MPGLALDGIDGSSLALGQGATDLDAQQLALPEDDREGAPDVVPDQPTQARRELTPGGRPRTPQSERDGVFGLPLGGEVLDAEVEEGSHALDVRHQGHDRRPTSDAANLLPHLPRIQAADVDQRRAPGSIRERTAWVQPEDREPKLPQNRTNRRNEATVRADEENGHVRCQSMIRNRKKVSPMMISSPPKSRRSVISSPLTREPFADLRSSM